MFSISYKEYLLSLQNKTADDQATTARIRDALKKLLNIPANALKRLNIPASVTIEYKTHNGCLNKVN